MTFSSSATDVATVDAAGVVTAVGAGEATITCTKGSYSMTFTVTVTAAGIVQTYDLVVYVNTFNKNTGTPWMTDENAQAMIEAFKAEGQAGHGKNIHLVCGRDTGWSALCDNVKSTENTTEEVNVLVARNASWTNTKLLAEGKFPVLAGTAVTGVASSWGYDTGSAAISGWTDEAQQDLAKAFLAFVAPIAE